MDPAAIIKVVKFKIEGTKKEYCAARLASTEEYQHDTLLIKDISLAQPGKYVVITPQKSLPNNVTSVVKVGPQVSLQFLSKND